MEEYEQLLNTLISDYEKDKPSAKRKGALEALAEAKILFNIVYKNKIK